MKLSTALWISLFCLGIGIVYYALQKRLIIIQLPSSITKSSSPQSHAPSKKNLMIYYWAQGSFKHESTSIIASDNKADTLRYIVTSWLTILEQSGSLPKKVGLEAVMLSSSGSDAYISFDRTIFAKNEPTFDKWMRVEGLLKTINAGQLGVSRIHLFVHHQPVQDPHLDFSQAWPIHGFMES